MLIHLNIIFINSNKIEMKLFLMTSSVVSQANESDISSIFQFVATIT